MRRTGCWSGIGHQPPGGRAVWYLCWFERGSADENAPEQDKSTFEAEHHSPTNQILEGKKIQLPKKKRRYRSRTKETPTASSQKVQNITPNYSTRTSTRNSSSIKKTEGSGANKDDWSVDDNPLANLTPTQIRQKARDMLKVNERIVEQIYELKSMHSQLQRDLYDKASELQFQESHKN